MDCDYSNGIHSNGGRIIEWRSWLSVYSKGTRRGVATSQYAKTSLGRPMAAAAYLECFLSEKK